MVCPKCGYSETAGEECAKCGIIFAKYLAMQKRRPGRTREKNDPDDPSDGLLDHSFGQPAEASAPDSFIGKFVARYFLQPYHTPWQPVTKWRMITLSIFFIVFIYLLSQEPFYRLYPDTNRIDSKLIYIFAEVNLVFHEAGHAIFRITGSRTLTILGGSLTQILIPLLVGYTFWRSRDATGMAFAMVWMFQCFLEVGRYMADARKPVLPLIGGMEPYGSHDWINLFNIWDLWSYDTAIAKMTWTLGWIGIVATVFWHTWQWLASPAAEADGDNDIFPKQ